MSSTLEEVSIIEDLSNTSAEWITDDTVPEGWSYKGQGSRTYVQSPKGSIYRSRRTAFAGMINSRMFSMTEINEMKSKLVHEGWVKSDDVPSTWMLKKPGGINATKYLGPGGEFFRTAGAAIKFVEKFREYFSFDDFVKITSLNTHSNPKPKKEGKWIPCDENMPEGWFYKVAKVGTNKVFKHYKSPEDMVFIGKRNVYKHFIENNYPEDEIAIMKRSFLADGWKIDDLLPNNWFYKIKPKSNSYVTSDGKYLKSREAVMECLTTDEEVQNFQTFLNKSALTDSRLKGWDWNHPSAPSGWGYKEAAGSDKINSKSHVQLLAPDGTRFRGQLLAYKFMIEKQFPRKEVEEMKVCLGRSGWMEDAALPPQWMFKHNKHRATEYLTHQGTFLQSRELALKVLREEEDFDSIKILSKWNNPLRQSKEVWAACKGFPSGWFSKTAKVGTGGRQYKMYAAPDGSQLKGTRLVLKYMVDNQYSEEYINQAKQCLYEEGWVEDPSIPVGWLLKRAKSYVIEYLTEEGVYLNTKETAMKYLREHNKEEAFQLLAESSFNSSMDASDSDNSWQKCSERMPEGWMFKTVSVGGADRSYRLFLSPEGEKFKGMKLLLKYFIDNNYPDKYIVLLREDFITDGWIMDSSLPENWLCKHIETGHSTFISATGEFLKTKDAAIKFLKEANNDADLAKISEFRSPSRTSDEGWLSCGDSMPKNWKFKQATVGASRRLYKLYRSPDGIIFKGRRRVLEFLVQRKYPETEIKAMRDRLKEEGWQHNDMLPENWLFRQTSKNCSKEFVNGAGKYFHSKQPALKYLKEQGNLQDVVLIESFALPFVEESPKPKLRHGDWFNFKNPLLKEFKYKKSASEKATMYTGPNGEFFKGKSLIIEHLIEKKASKETISAMRDSFKEDGWRFDVSLPRNWMWKRNTHNLMLLAPAGKLFSSKEKAVSYLEKQKRSRSEMSLLRKFSPSH